jgi:patatin-like phospholipase
MPDTISDSAAPLPLYQVLEEEYVALHGPLPADHTAEADPDKRLKMIYARIHLLKKKRAALCISGGGIRSATFALGVLQGLARRSLLKEFDYLSTVSGGGYVGSWLSAWIHRESGGPDAVFRKLSEKPASPLEPESPPIRQLRAFSNYMSPKLGLLSADTWTLVAIITRNLLLNWTVFFPLLIAVLMIPRICVSFVRLTLEEPLKSNVLTLILIAAFVLGVVAVAYMGIFRPSTGTYRKPRYRPLASQKGFLWCCLLPSLGMALGLSVYWAWLRNSDVRIEDQLSPIFGLKIDYPWPFILFGLALHAVAWAIYALWTRYVKVKEFAIAVIVGLCGGFLVWVAAAKIFGQPVFDRNESIPETEFYVCFALPLVLSLLLLAITLFVGVASRITSDEDREWLARFGAWSLIAIVVWGSVSFIVLFGPVALLWFGTKVQAIVASAGGISGFLTAKLGNSSETPARNSEQSDTTGATVRKIVLALAAPVFVLVLLVGLSTGTSKLIVMLKSVLAERPLGLDWHIESLPDQLASLTDHLQTVHGSSIRVLGLLFVGFLAIGFAMALFVNINKFSLHSMYRNRLIRAYLGASREKRTPNPFTGFDPDDNIQMHELAPQMFHAGSFNDSTALVNKLRDSSNPVAVHIRSLFSSRTRALLTRASVPRPEMTDDTLIEELNKVVEAESIYQPARFASISLDEETRALIKQSPAGNMRAILNRLLLEQAFPGEIRPFRSHKPLHVVNMALNLVRGSNLAWQQRKAESFTASALHSGSYSIVDASAVARGSYRRSREYGNANQYDGVDGISLGTAVAISGAAVSPNMGYHSSAVITFLLTLFNARLGWWLGNPATAGRDTYRRPGPLLSIRPLVAEAFGLTDDNNKYIYLSDGGHFENLALYEMVLRRSHIIVVSDAGQDPEYSFEDLGNALRKIRIDLGVPIDIEDIRIYSREKTEPGKYCAIGNIRYSEVDGGGKERDGILVYIKPAINGTEPADVFNYARQSKLFPHETTADQFFSESQFESYRMLGFHAIDEICGEWTGSGLDAWSTHVKDTYLGSPPALPG